MVNKCYPRDAPRIVSADKEVDMISPEPFTQGVFSRRIQKGFVGTVAGMFPTILFRDFLA